MAKVDVLDILRAKQMSPLDFQFESLWIPPIYCYLTQQDIDALRNIATSIRLSSKIQEKYRMIDNIMRARGFKRFSAGTNRVVYSFLEDDRFVAKIAVDKVAMQDNKLEYENQFLLKPYVAKMFYTSPCGTVGFAERVLPIKNADEFRQIAGDVFEILIHKVLGKYVVEDIGTHYFMNYGVRIGFAPVLLDYPYVYKLDGKKLFCNKFDPETGMHCDGEIDYDVGFNHLTCTKCGKTYLARDLQDDSIENKIVIKGGNTMKVIVRRGDEIVSAPIPSEEVMRRPSRPVAKSNGIKVVVNYGYAPVQEEPKIVHDIDESSIYPGRTITVDLAPNKEDFHVNVQETKENGEQVQKPFDGPETGVQDAEEAVEETKEDPEERTGETEGTNEVKSQKDETPQNGSFLDDDDIEGKEEEEELKEEEPFQEPIQTDTRIGDRQPRGANGRFISKGNGSGKTPKKRKKGIQVTSSFIPTEGAESSNG